MYDSGRIVRDSSVCRWLRLFKIITGSKQSLFLSVWASVWNHKSMKTQSMWLVVTCILRLKTFTSQEIKMQFSLTQTSLRALNIAKGWTSHGPGNKQQYSDARIGHEVA